MRQRRALQERLERIAERMLEFADRFRSRENREKERQQFREASGCLISAGWAVSFLSVSTLRSNQPTFCF